MAPDKAGTWPGGRNPEEFRRADRIKSALLGQAKTHPKREHGHSAFNRNIFLAIAIKRGSAKLKAIPLNQSVYDFGTFWWEIGKLKTGIVIARVFIRPAPAAYGRETEVSAPFNFSW